MTAKRKRQSMAEALKDRQDVKAFLCDKASNRSNEQTRSEKPPERRIAVTLRLPEKIAHALIDASAERRKKRQRNWSQQDIVAEALATWLPRTSKQED
jgi:hypothetical protein